MITYAYIFVHMNIHIHPHICIYTRINAYTGFSGVLPVVLLSKLKSEYYLEPVDDTCLESLMQGGSTRLDTPPYHLCFMFERID